MATHDTSGYGVFIDIAGVWETMTRHDNIDFISQEHGACFGSSLINRHISTAQLPENRLGEDSGKKELAYIREIEVLQQRCDGLIAVIHDLLKISRSSNDGMRDVVIDKANWLIGEMVAGHDTPPDGGL
jgi:hypothetical protein